MDYCVLSHFRARQDHHLTCRELASAGGSTFRCFSLFPKWSLDLQGGKSSRDLWGGNSRERKLLKFVSKKDGIGVVGRLLGIYRGWGKERWGKGNYRDRRDDENFLLYRHGGT